MSDVGAAPLPQVVDPGEGRALWTVFHPTRDLVLLTGGNDRPSAAPP